MKNGGMGKWGNEKLKMKSEKLGSHLKRRFYIFFPEDVIEK